IDREPRGDQLVQHTDMGQPASTASGEHNADRSTCKPSRDPLQSLTEGGPDLNKMRGSRSQKVQPSCNGSWLRTALAEEKVAASELLIGAPQGRDISFPGDHEDPIGLTNAKLCPGVVTTPSCVGDQDH